MLLVNSVWTSSSSSQATPPFHPQGEVVRGSGGGGLASFSSTEISSYGSSYYDSYHQGSNMREIPMEDLEIAMKVRIFQPSQICNFVQMIEPFYKLQGFFLPLFIIGQMFVFIICGNGKLLL